MLPRGPAGPAHACGFILASIWGETARCLYSGGQLRFKSVFTILVSRKIRKTQGALEGRFTVHREHNQQRRRDLKGQHTLLVVERAVWSRVCWWHLSGKW